MTKILCFDHLSKDQEEELGLFFSNHFGFSSTDGNNMIYGGELVVEHYAQSNKNHRPEEIKKIRPVLDKNSSRLDNWEERAREALTTSLGIEVGHTVLFSPYSITGKYRFEDKFQILPVPENAEKPDFLRADHPFILEVSYLKSPNDQINIHRKQKAFNSIILLLNIIMKHGIKSIGNTVRHEWVLDTSVHPWKSKYCQLGYILLGNYCPAKDSLGFSSAEEYETISEMDTNTDYFGISLSAEDKFCLPENMTLLLNKFYSLCESDSENFGRALYWKKIASDSFYISKTNAYKNLVISIESLIPEAKASGFCKTCGRERKESITQSFHNFVECFVSGGGNSNFGKKLYEIRSNYTHGKQLMLSDVSIYSFGIPEYHKENDRFRLLAKVVQISLLNWLLFEEKHIN